MKIIYLKLNQTSWQNLFRVIRHRDTKLTADTSNFWASIQHLEQQLSEVEHGDAVELDSPFIDPDSKVVRSAMTEESP